VVLFLLRHTPAELPPDVWFPQARVLLLPLLFLPLLLAVSLSVLLLLPLLLDLQMLLLLLLLC
jgi:hypothetical protein